VKIRSALILCLSLFSTSFAVLCQSPPRFLISHIIYPDLEDYIQLIDEIYTELGFKVSMLPTPATRGLILLNEGVVDGDLLRLKNTAVDYPNVMVVEIPLNTAELVLVCVPGVPCQRDVIRDEKVNILLPDSAKKQFAAGEFLATAISAPATSSALDMLKAQRFFYAIYAIDNAMGRDLLKEFNYAVLKDLSIYHVINKKHAALLPQIEAKLREKLPAFIVSRNQ
jgi:hypothetical protein